MSEEQLKAFLEKVKGDTILQEKLKAATTADTVVAIAKDEGFAVSINDLELDLNQLGDEELENISGGRNLASRNVSCALCMSIWCYKADGTPH